MLNLEVSAAVLRIRNVLSLQGRKVVWDQICLPAALFQGLTEQRVMDRSSTLYHLYQTEFGVTVVRAEERLHATLCSEELAQVLCRPAGTPLIELQRVALGLTGQAVEYRVAVIDTTEHEYVSHLVPS